MHPNDGRVISNFIVQALRNNPITIFGDGLQTRSFCYVSELCDALTRLMESPAAITGPVNFGNPREWTILELAEIVLRMTNSKSDLIFHERLHDDPKQRQPDVSLAKSALGWTPAIGLEEGLVPTIAYFDQLLTEGSF